MGQAKPTAASMAWRRCIPSGEAWMPAILQEVQQGGSGAPRESQQWPCDSAAVGREWGKEGEARWGSSTGKRERQGERRNKRHTKTHICTHAEKERESERVQRYEQRKMGRKKDQADRLGRQVHLVVSYSQAKNVGLIPSPHCCFIRRSSVFVNTDQALTSSLPLHMLS